MYDEAVASAGGVAGDVVDKPKSRSEKITEYRVAHESEYKKACEDASCRCSATKAELLIMGNYERPPVD
jgi:hypothetical protein